MTRFALKTLAAVAACAAASVHAQEGPVLYGLIDMGAGRFQAPGGARQWATESGGLSTSFLGIRGTDDLGGGLRARFGLETYIGVSNGTAGRSAADPFWTRSAYVGLQGAFGSSVLGRSPTPLWQSTRLFNPFGDSVGFSPSVRQYFGNTFGASGNGSVGVPGAPGVVIGDSRWNNSVAFSSPEPEGGHGLSYNVQFNASGREPGSTGKNIGANALYTSGPLAATLAWQRARNGAGPFPAGFDEQNTYQVGASYQLPVVKLFGQAGTVRTRATVAVKATLFQVGAAVPVGLGFVIGSYGHARSESAGIASINRTASIGYDYFLSKNTDVYAMWMNERVSLLSSANTLAAGLRLRF